MPKNPWRDQLLTTAAFLLDASEGHPVKTVLEKLSAEDLNILVGRLRIRLEAEAEAGMRLALAQRNGA